MTISNVGENPERFVLAVLLATVVAFVAYRSRALTFGGAVAAVVVGSATVGGSGWWSGAALVVFFVTSTILSKVRSARSTEIRQQRGHRRDAIQVFANGGIAALMSLIGWILDTDHATAGALCAISAATADTWATEIGRLTQWPPRSIVNGTRVPVGTSGAVSVPGTAASLVGSLAIAGFAAAGVTNDWVRVGASAPATLVLIAVAGFAGSLLDSLLGATLQESFYCESCGKATESRVHWCGAGTIRVGGVARINNDVVNLVSIAVPSIAVILALAATG
jgi:uncharacterized protein (TIGR00297 family)